MDDYDYDFRSAIRSEIDELCAGGSKFLHQFCAELRTEIMGTVGTPQEWGEFQQIGGTMASLLDNDSNPLVKERKIHYVIGNYDASTYYKIPL